MPLESQLSSVRPRVKCIWHARSNAGSNAAFEVTLMQSQKASTCIFLSYVNGDARRGQQTVFVAPIAAVKIAAWRDRQPRSSRYCIIWVSQ